MNDTGDARTFDKPERTISCAEFTVFCQLKLTATRYDAGGRNHKLQTNEMSFVYLKRSFPQSTAWLRNIAKEKAAEKITN